jgi:type I site-specific restriction endonuclease
MANETNTCRQYVEPKLSDAGWQIAPHDYTEQYYFTAGRIQPRSRKQRGERKFADYLLFYNGDFPIAVVEAKAKYKTADEGLEQAIDYARILDVKFAYATNGVGIVEYDFTTGMQSDELAQFPSLEELWQRLTGDELQQLRADIAQKLLMLFYPTPGKDIPTCKNVVLAKVIRSMTDFKQMIGRGTRVQEDRGKISFNIIDYTNSTILFEDPEFDGEPALINLTEIDDSPKERLRQRGKIITQTESAETIADELADRSGFRGLPATVEELSYKYYVDGGSDEIICETIYDLNGNYGLQVSQILSTTKDRILTLYRSQLEIQQRWIDPQARIEIIDLLDDLHMDFDELRKVTNKPDADPFDLLCHIAFDAPVFSYKQRAENLRRRQPDLFQQYGDEARAVLEILLNKYAQTGIDEFNLSDAFKANPELLKYGNVAKIAQYFGGVIQLKQAIQQLQVQLYSA